MTDSLRRAVGRSRDYLPAARRCQRVAFSIFLCFFLRMRLRRFLIRDPMSTGTLVDQGILRHAARTPRCHAPECRVSRGPGQSIRSPASSAGGGDLGEAEPEHGPAALGLVDVDAPAFVPGHLGHDGQAEARTGRPRALGAR